MKRHYESIEVGTERQGKYFEMKTAHFHPVYEIYYLIAGNRKFFIESEIYNISKGDMVFVDKNVMHKSTYSSDKENERAFIRFNDNHIARLIEKFGRKEIEDCFKQKVFSIPMQRREYVGSIMRQLYNEYKNPDDFSHELMECYLEELLIFIIRYRKNVSDHLGVSVYNSSQSLNKSDEHIQSAAKYIVDNYNKNVTLSEIANFVNMSNTYFSKKFKEVTGFGFKEYLLNLRIKKACELLLETKLSITDIAYEAGFNDSNYFGDVFKKCKGISPLQYRKNRELI